ncbi:MAG: hypothetical protein IKY34_03280 [Ruminiclostridium sp.]|nr:hypothetical protein [Ruminiclostridium sp.]
MKNRRLTSLALCFVLFTMFLSGCGKSIEKQLVDGGIWYDLDGNPQVVYFSDGTGKDHGTLFTWSITEDNRLYINEDGWTETYSISFEKPAKNNSKVKVADMYLRLIDPYGDEILLKTGGLVQIQDADYDWSQWEQ